MQTGRIFQYLRQLKVTIVQFENTNCLGVIRLAVQSILSQISRGERSFIFAMIGTSILGATLSCVAVMHLSETSPESRISTAITYWTLLAGCIGGASGLWACYERWFGHEGARGWASALIGAFITSGIGSVIAGTLILPFYGTMFGPFQLIMLIVAYPSLGLIWLGMLMCAHGLLGQWRQERDSIFQSGQFSA